MVSEKAQPQGTGKGRGIPADLTSAQGIRLHLLILYVVVKSPPQIFIQILLLGNHKALDQCTFHLEPCF